MTCGTDCGCKTERECQFSNVMTMAYDIFGNDLRKGHCEVHPHVHEEYPCSVCYAENREKQQQQPQPDYYQDRIIAALQEQNANLEDGNALLLEENKKLREALKELLPHCDHLLIEYNTSGIYEHASSLVYPPKQEQL